MILDGTRGTVLSSPRRRGGRGAGRGRRAVARSTTQLEEVVDRPAVTTDGVPVRCAATSTFPTRSRPRRKHSAEGVGLLRTEFLITGRDELPTEDEQAALLPPRRRGVSPATRSSFGPMTWAATSSRRRSSAAAEANPFLGWRAIRVCLDQPELLRTQIRAVLRAAAHADICADAPADHAARRSRAHARDCGGGSGTARGQRRRGSPHDAAGRHGRDARPRLFWPTVSPPRATSSASARTT